MMGWNNTGSWGSGHWLVMILMMVIFWGLLIAAVLWVARIARAGRNDQARSNVPMPGADEELAQRFARGDINEDEFQRRRDLLHSPSTRA